MTERKMTPARVIEIRKKLGLNATAFARHINCSRQTIYEWENGLKFPSGVSERLLELLEELHDNGCDNREGSGSRQVPPVE